MRPDPFGGIAGELMLPEDATLGMYRLMLRQPGRSYGGGSFRVEEYKKPEFEVVVDAPSKPIQLGEKIKATLSAKYYFGAPVTDATVKYTIRRTSHDDRWVSDCALGLALWPRLLVVCLRRALVSRLERMGLHRTARRLVATLATRSARIDRPARSEDRSRRNA